MSYPWPVSESLPARFQGRYGLVFQPHPQTPGTLAQQAVIRSGIEAFGYGTPRWRMLWYFARAYKARQDYVHGGLAGSRHYVTISIEGSLNRAWSNTMVLGAQWSAADLWLFFCHEWGHIFDEYVLDHPMRAQLMEAIGSPYRPNWRGDSNDYWNQPNELFAWSFQRLCNPEIPDLPNGYSREVMAEILPDWDKAWTEAGLPITDE